MTWGDSLTIRQAVNGFILEEEEENIEEEVLNTYVYEEEDGDEHIVSMLYAVAAHFGVFSSKHERRSLVIEWRKENE